ncbi:MAG TPA: cupredoxin domain-containing protein [Methylomirabilota bacterium]|nr:cupredoxin domain-containing protein [Methylomirabilota bacterium]
MRRVLAALVMLGVAAAAAAALAADPPEIALTIEKNRFQPDEIKVKAGVPFVLVVTNKDAAPIEFECKELRVEKVVPPGATVKVRIRALKPGSYPFVDDFHHETTGRIVAE